MNYSMRLSSRPNSKRLLTWNRPERTVGGTATPFVGYHACLADDEVHEGDGKAYLNEADEHGERNRRFAQDLTLQPRLRTLVSYEVCLLAVSFEQIPNVSR